MPRRLKESAEPSAGFAGAEPGIAREQWGQDAPHPLTEPGAYEWWYFHAMSPDGTGVLLSLFEGLPFHPKYLEHINRYLLFQKSFAGLKASRYPAAYLAVYEKGKRVAQSLNLYPPDSSVGTPGEIRIGPNRITLRQDNSIGIVARTYPYNTSHGRPKKRPHELLSADLSFVPTFQGVQHTRPFRAPDKTGAAHHWVLAAPHGTMTGTVHHLDTAKEVSLLDLDIDALAYHDHVYGQGGLATGVSTLLWGFIQGDDWTAAWHQSLRPATLHERADGLVVFRKDHNPVVIDSPETRLSKHHFSNWLLKHPGKVSMHGSDTHGHPVELLVTHDQVLDTAPFHTRLQAQGTLNMPGRNPTLIGRGTTHVLKLRRLRWPVLSDLTLLAITPVSRDDPIWGE